MKIWKQVLTCHADHEHGYAPGTFWLKWFSHEDGRWTYDLWHLQAKRYTSYSYGIRQSAEHGRGPSSTWKERFPFSIPTKNRTGNRPTPMPISATTFAWQWFVSLPGLHLKQMRDLPVGDLETSLSPTLLDGKTLAHSTFGLYHRCFCSAFHTTLWHCLYFYHTHNSYSAALPVDTWPLFSFSFSSVVSHFSSNLALYPISCLLALSSRGIGSNWYLNIPGNNSPVSWSWLKSFSFSWLNAFISLPCTMELILILLMYPNIRNFYGSWNWLRMVYVEILQCYTTKQLSYWLLRALLLRPRTILLERSCAQLHRNLPDLIQGSLQEIAVELFKLHGHFLRETHHNIRLLIMMKMNQRLLVMLVRVIPPSPPDPSTASNLQCYGPGVCASNFSKEVKLVPVANEPLQVLLTFQHYDSILDSPCVIVLHLDSFEPAAISSDCHASFCHNGWT